jgi:hypothetical protein
MDGDGTAAGAVEGDCVGEDVADGVELMAPADIGAVEF